MGFALDCVQCHIIPHYRQILELVSTGPVKEQFSLPLNMSHVDTFKMDIPIKDQSIVERRDESDIPTAQIKVKLVSIQYQHWC